jgi:glycosyltransferase involved in cell wall biosynthesis
MFATAGLGVSSNAAASLFGENWRTDGRWRVHPAAVDLQAFEEHPNRTKVREQLGIPASAIVIGHVGRFVEEKNHQFIVHLAELFDKRHDVRFLLIGGGPLKAHIHREVHERGLDDRFIFLPPRADVPRLMLSAMDAFIFPSLSEGLGLSLLEAQAAGLPCFASDAVPSEAIAVPELVQQLPLSAGPALWAEAILQRMRTPPQITQKIALERLEAAFDIKKNAERLVQFYQAVAA